MSSNTLSWINPKIEVKETKNKGRGLFAKEPIQKGETIIIQGGKIAQSKELEEPPLSNFNYDCFQIDEGFYICPIETDPDKKEGVFIMNHSCNPNCGVKGQTIFVALRDIIVGEELCYEYAMTDVYREDEEWKEMECLCGAENCRGVITGNDWQIKELQERHQGYFSYYVRKMINANY